MKFNKNLLLDNLVVEQEELFKLAADKLFQEGYTRKSYLKALVKRESVFPTGLRTKSVGVAIPHCDPVNIKKDGILVARLNKPVLFRQMGDFETKVEVYLVFFICSTGGQEQLIDLRELMALFQDKNYLDKVYHSKNIYNTLISWKE